MLGGGTHRGKYCTQDHQESSRVVQTTLLDNKHLPVVPGVTYGCEKEWHARAEKQ